MIRAKQWQQDRFAKSLRRAAAGRRGWCGTEETEKRKSELSTRLVFLEEELRKRYRLVKDAEPRFITEKGKVFFLTAIRDFNAIVVEYAESLAEAEIDRFEDGDLFYLEDLSGNEMLSAVIREIEED